MALVDPAFVRADGGDEDLVEHGPGWDDEHEDGGDGDEPGGEVSAFHPEEDD